MAPLHVLHVGDRTSKGRTELALCPEKRLLKANTITKRSADLLWVLRSVFARRARQICTSTGSYSGHSTGKLDSTPSEMEGSGSSPLGERWNLHASTVKRSGSCDVKELGIVPSPWSEWFPANCRRLQVPHSYVPRTFVYRKRVS